MHDLIREVQQKKLCSSEYITRWSLGSAMFRSQPSRKTSIAFAFELGTFFCARIGFNLMAVYMVEMFPTCVRSSATMMFRQALVVGGACCPLIASIGRDLPSVSFAIFGVAMSGFGLFVLILPETKGSSLCDTMEEQEKRDQTINTSHC
uniref:Major facilitator superfamily (MFS) profile domain-containing protein n=1 Tax=Brassica oleracea var. oleracea TaxID=109376 RepID=A0A0D3BG31_BRAOL